MTALIAGRTASELPGLDIAEQKSWRHFSMAALRVFAVLNRRLTDTHQLSLADVRLLDILSNCPAGSARMGDLACALPALPSRLTRQVHRLEQQQLVQRTASPHDGRAVVATIADKGRTQAQQAMVTYLEELRTHFLDPLSHSQMTAMTDNCRRIATGLTPGRLHSVPDDVSAGYPD